MVDGFLHVHFNTILLQKVLVTHLSLCIFDKSVLCITIFFEFFFVGSAWSFGFFIPATTANDLRLRRIFYPRFYPLHLFCYLNSWERASIFPFECSVLNKGTTGTISITSLVWRGPWLGIEPVTSRTRSQHSTTRLSRRRFHHYWDRMFESTLFCHYINKQTNKRIWENTLHSPQVI